MLSAPPDRLSRARVALLALLWTTGCRQDRLGVSGSLAPGEEAATVRVEGDSARTPIDSARFALTHAPVDPLVLYFAVGSDSARMEVAELPRDARLGLEGIWFHDGVAFPTRISLDGADRVLVNGLRMADEGRLPASVRAAGVVLAAVGEGDALLLRPQGSELPDLRVVVSPAARVRTAAGDSLAPSDLEAGDSVRLAGSAEGGYVTAREIVVSASVAERVARRAEESRKREAEKRASRERASPDREEGPEATPRRRNFVERLLGIHRGGPKKAKGKH